MLDVLGLINQLTSDKAERWPHFLFSACQLQPIQCASNHFYEVDRECERTFEKALVCSLTYTVRLCWSWRDEFRAFQTTPDSSRHLFFRSGFVYKLSFRVLNSFFELYTLNSSI
jgi:hypothetical protein